MSSTQRLQLFLWVRVLYTSIRLSYSWINYAANYELLWQPVLGALTFMIYQETHTGTATMFCGSKGYILLLRAILCFDDCRAWMVLVKLIKIFRGGLNPPHLPLNTAWERCITDHSVSSFRNRSLYPIFSQSHALCNLVIESTIYWSSENV